MNIFLYILCMSVSEFYVFITVMKIWGEFNCHGKKKLNKQLDTIK